MRHFGSRPSARDHLDQLVAVENGLCGFGGLAGRARIAAAVAVGPVAELTIRLLLEQAFAKGDVLRERQSARQHDAAMATRNCTCARCSPEKPARSGREPAAAPSSNIAESETEHEQHRLVALLLELRDEGVLAASRCGSGRTGCAIYCLPLTSKVIGGALKPTPTLIFQNWSSVVSS